MKKKIQPQRIWTVVGIGACLLVIVPLGYKVLTDEAYKNEAAKWRAKGKAIGMPDGPNDLRKPIVGANAADLYKEAFAMVTLDKYVTDLEKAVHDKNWPTAEKLASQNNAYFDTLVSASQVQEVDFGHRYKDALEELLPEFAQYKRGVKLLRGRALVRAHNGDLSGAFDDLEAGMRIAQHAGAEPCLIATLVQVACSTIVLDASAEILRDTNGSPEAVAGVRKLEQAWAKPVLKNGIRTEWLMALQIPTSLSKWAEFAATDSEASLNKAKAAAAIASPYEVQTVAMKVQLKVVELSEDNSKSASQKSQEIQAYTDNLLASCSPPGRILSDMVVPVFSQTFTAVTKDEAQAALISTAADLYDHRNRTGRFPTNLSAVGSGNDVWSKGPMGYRLQGNGFVLWGMGQNGKDDGGALNPKISSASPDHVVNMADKTTRALIPPKG